MCANIINVNAPIIEIKCKEYFLLNALKENFDFSVIINIFIYVFKNLNSLEQNKIFSMSNGKTLIMFSINEQNNICLHSGQKTSESFENTIQVKPLFMEIKPREHFLCSILKREFEISAIVSVYAYVLESVNIQRDKNLEITTGKNTLVFEVDDNNNIHLITGWNGNRKSKVKRK